MRSTKVEMNLVPNWEEREYTPAVFVRVGNKGLRGYGTWKNIRKSGERSEEGTRLAALAQDSYPLRILGLLRNSEQVRKEPREKLKGHAKTAMGHAAQLSGSLKSYSTRGALSYRPGRPRVDQPLIRVICFPFTWEYLTSYKLPTLPLERLCPAWHSRVSLWWFRCEVRCSL
jgi:hypothetical protein